MTLLSKVSGTPFICKIYLDFNGSLTAVNGAVQQNFSDSQGNHYTWKETHFGRKTVSYSETEKESKAGSSYQQKLQITFPNQDNLRADRIEKIKTAKFVRLELSNGNSIALGRNDYYQNKKLSITQKSDALKTTITFSCLTMFTSGILQITDVSNVIDFFFPTVIPKNFKSI